MQLSVRADLVSPVLVGRESPMAEFEALLRRAHGGEGVVVLVGGEAGVGKSRLVREAATTFSAGGGRSLSGACMEIGGAALPVAPLVHVLRSLARSTPR